MICFAFDAWNIELSKSKPHRHEQLRSNPVVGPAAAMADVISGGICCVVSYPA
jgi:hypothetical protein